MTPSTLRIMTIGDSITDQGNAFRTRLADLLVENKISFSYVGSRGQRIRHEGYSGATTTDIRDSIGEWIERSQPDVVLLMIGTNDVWRKMPLPNAILNIEVCIQKIFLAQPKTQVILAKILPMIPEAANAALFNDLIEKTFGDWKSSSKRLSIVDMFSGMSVVDDLKDGVHPNLVGYKKIAERWFLALLKSTAQD